MEFKIKAKVFEAFRTDEKVLSNGFKLFKRYIVFQDLETKQLYPVTVTGKLAKRFAILRDVETVDVTLAIAPYTIPNSAGRMGVALEIKSLDVSTWLPKPPKVQRGPIKVDVYGTQNAAK